MLCCHWYLNTNQPPQAGTHLMTARMFCRAQGYCRDHTRNWWSFPRSGNAAVFHSPECTGLAAEICLSALHSASCTVPAQLTHREPGNSHKYINCKLAKLFHWSIPFPYTNLDAMPQKPVNLSYSLILSSEVLYIAPFSLLLLYLISLWILNRLSWVFCHTRLNCLTFHPCFLREYSLTQFNTYYLWGSLSACERHSFL